MNIEHLKSEAEKQIMDALGEQTSKMFTLTFGDLLTEDVDADENMTIEASLVFEFGNVRREHSLLIGWNSLDGIGLEHGEDGEIYAITPASMGFTLYMDLALTGLDDDYLQ